MSAFSVAILFVIVIIVQVDQGNPATRRCEQGETAKTANKDPTVQLWKEDDH